MNKNNVLKSKSLEIFVSIMLTIVLLIFILSSTYARYRSTKELELTSDVARWNIKLNGESITDTSVDFSSIITPVFPGNSHVAPNVIAPTVEGYFDVVIDYSEVDVSFTYSFLINSSESLVTDLVVFKYDVFDCDITDTANAGATASSTTTIADSDLSNSATVTGNIPYSASATDKTKSIRVYVKWIDNLIATMNNAADTNATITNETTAGAHATNSLAITASFVQS